jgi:hypothetical protein
LQLVIILVGNLSCLIFSFFVDFEVKSKDETCEKKHEEPSLTSDNVPVEAGSVKRQTQEIEMKYFNLFKVQSVKSFHKQSDDSKSMTNVKSMRTNRDTSPNSTVNESSTVFKRSYSYNEHRSSPNKPCLLNRVNSLRHRRQDEGSSIVNATSASRGASISCVRLTSAAPGVSTDSLPCDYSESSLSGDGRTDLGCEILKSTLTKSFSFTLPSDASFTRFVSACDAVPLVACVDDKAAQSHVRQRCRLFETFGRSLAKQEKPVIRHRSLSVHETHSVSTTVLSPVLWTNSVSQINTINIASLNSSSSSVSHANCDIASDVSLKQVSNDVCITSVSHLIDTTESAEFESSYTAKQDVVTPQPDAVTSEEPAKVCSDTATDGSLLMRSGITSKPATAAAVIGQIDSEGITVVGLPPAIALDHAPDVDTAAHAAVPMNHQYAASLTKSSDNLLETAGGSIIFPLTAAESLTSATPGVITEAASSDASKITKPAEPINLMKSVALNDVNTMVAVPIDITTGKMTVAETVPLTRHLDLAMCAGSVTTAIVTRAAGATVNASHNISASVEESPVSRRKLYGDSLPLAKLSVLYSVSDTGIKSASDQLEI